MRDPGLSQAVLAAQCAVAAQQAEALEKEASTIAANSGIQNPDRFVECLVAAAMFRVAQSFGPEAMPQTTPRFQANGDPWNTAPGSVNWVKP